MDMYRNLAYERVPGEIYGGMLRRPQLSVSRLRYSFSLSLRLDGKA
jgi:hypothetical protein